MRLRLAVVRRHMATTRAGAARVLRRHGNKPAAVPRQLVVQLATELEPALVEDSFVQAGLSPNISTRLLNRPRRRLGHVPHLQVLDTHHRVVLADCGRGLVQVVAAGVADACVNLLDARFPLLPVAAEFHFAAHRLLRFAQPHLMPLEAAQRRVERAVRERGEPGNAHVDADRAALRDGLLDLALGLDRHKPFAARLADGDIPHRAQHIPAEANSQPAELGQEQAVVALIELDLLGIGVTEALALPLLLEARESRPFGEEVGVRPLQVLERLLQRVDRRIGEPRRLYAVAPFGEQLAQAGVAQLLLAAIKAFLLQCQRLVEHKPARAREAAHLTLLLAGRHECELEGLEALHVVNYTLGL
ncbi:protein of unknown function [Thiomonas sp. Sup16B3]|nr:protein of unknown function [Thiomonas sp. Sup16B3]